MEVLDLLGTVRQQLVHEPAASIHPRRAEEAGDRLGLPQDRERRPECGDRDVNRGQPREQRIPGGPCL